MEVDYRILIIGTGNVLGIDTFLEDGHCLMFSRIRSIVVFAALTVHFFLVIQGIVFAFRSLSADEMQRVREEV